jgi:hypothetical protein
MLAILAALCASAHLLIALASVTDESVMVSSGLYLFPGRLSLDSYYLYGQAERDDLRAYGSPSWLRRLGSWAA